MIDYRHNPDDFMATPANLDAFLPREDFISDGDVPVINEFHDMGISDLLRLHPVLRKPDFQRTTDDWDAVKITQLIKSFSHGDVIPGLIFWPSPNTGNILVIDGAHRVSAILAWAFDDYGDGKISREFAGYQENSDQRAAADAAREMAEREVGKFKFIFEASQNPVATKAAKNLCLSLSAARFKIQWVKGSAKMAEQSFERINSSSVKLEPIELKLIRNRESAEAIATRAIIQNAAGHQYWSNFPANHKKDTIRIAKEIHALLFNPPLKKKIKTAHLPIGGKAYSGDAMQTVLTIIESVEKYPERRGSIAQKTVFILQKTWQKISIINGSDASCMGLHPAIYFYSTTTGQHQPSALLAVIKWLTEFDKEKRKTFTSVRKYFEGFLNLNARALSETIRARGSKMRSVKTLIRYYQLVLDELVLGNTPKEILEKMRTQPKLFPFAQNLPDFNDYEADFDDKTSSAGYINDAVPGLPRCDICDARYHPDSVNDDHKVPKSQGGDGNPKNWGATHYYCNSTKAALIPIIAAARQRIEARLAPTPKDSHAQP